MSYNYPLRVILSAEDIPDSNLRRWTLSAMDCYFRNRDCSNCPIAKILETPCYMRLTVKRLFDKFGKPSRSLYNRLLAEERRRHREF